MNRLLLLFIGIAFVGRLFGQVFIDRKELKGKWVISEFQSYGNTGLTYQVAEMYVGDTVLIDSSIIRTMEQNKYTNSLGLSSYKYELNVIKSNKIDDLDEFFDVNFSIKPILLEIDSKNDKIYYIKTDCNDKLFREILFRKNKKNLYLIDDGIIYILSELSNLSKEKRINYLDSNDLKQGLWVEYISDGEMKTETYYVDGVPNGIYKTYRPDGTLYGSGYKLEGQINGDFVSFDKEGKVLSYTKWSNGKLIDKKITNPNAKETGTVEVIDGKKYVWVFGELQEVVE